MELRTRKIHFYETKYTNKSFKNVPKNKIGVPVFTIVCFTRNILQTSIYLPTKKKCVDTLCYTCWNTRADCFGVLFGFQQLLFFSRTFRYVNWGRFAQFRPLSLSGPAPLWYVIALPLVCRVPQSESNYINEPRSSGRPRAPLAPDLQQSLLLGAQQVKDFMVLNAPRQTKYWIGGSALLYHLHFWL